MSQDRGNEGTGNDDPGLDSAAPGMGYDLFGNQLMPAAPDPVRSVEPARSGADRSSSPPSFGAGSTPSSPSTQQQQPSSAVSPLTYVIAGVAALALIGGGFFLVKNVMSSKSGDVAVVSPSSKTGDTTPTDTKPGAGSGPALSAHDVFTKCMPSIVMLTVHYKGMAVLNPALHLSGMESGTPILVTTDDDDHLTFYDEDEKPTKTTECRVQIDGKVLPAKISVNGDKFSVQLCNSDGEPLTHDGQPIVISKGFEFAKNPLGATGSGYFVRPDIVATNRHVVSMGSIGSAAFKKASAQITDKAGQYEITEKPIYVDPYHDLALVYLPGTPAKPLVLHNDLSDLKVGDPVYALGSPLGYGGSISEGVISSDRLREDIRRPHGERFMIQHSAKIDHGNSGGPLVNNRGEVLGVNTLSIGSSVFLSVAEKEVEAILNRPEVIAKIEALEKNNGPDLGTTPPSPPQEGSTFVHTPRHAYSNSGSATTPNMSPKDVDPGK